MMNLKKINNKKVKKFVIILLLIILPAAGSFTFISLFGTSTFHIDAFEFQLSLEFFDSGTTEINIPPIGEVSALTHNTPVKINITLQNVDIEQLQEMFKDSVTQQEIVDSFSNEIKNITNIYALKILLLAAAGGAFSILLFNTKKIKTYIAGALVGTALVGILLFGTYYTYDAGQFSSPQYRGALKAAPWMVGLAEESFSKVDKLGEQMELVAANFYELFQKIDTLEPHSSLDNTYKILHVSDIHNNPAAYRFIRQVVNSFNVSLVIDTGDITDYGTPLEAELVDEVGKLNVPYIFVAGNHDSPSITAVMDDIPNVTVLDRNTVTYSGISIAGLADAASFKNEMRADNDEIKDNVDSFRNYLSNSVQPAIIATHKQVTAEEFINSAPVILYGHNHQLSVKEKGESVLVNAGTSGAAGIRQLNTSEDIPYSVVLLYFQKDEEEWKLLACDILEISDLNSGFTLKRRFFTD